MLCDIEFHRNRRNFDEFLFVQDVVMKPWKMKIWFYVPRSLQSIGFFVPVFNLSCARPKKRRNFESSLLSLDFSKRIQNLKSRKLDTEDAFLNKESIVYSVI